MRPRIYKHNLSGNLSYQYLQTNLFFNTAIGYTTVGSTLVRNNQNRSGISLDTITLGGKTKLIFNELNPKIHKLSFTLDLTVPISEEARSFGYYVLPSGQLSYATVFLNKQLVISNSARATYYHAKYKYIQTTNEEMPLADLEYNISSVYLPVSSLQLIYTIGFNKTVYEEGSKPFKFQTKISVSYLIDNLSITGSYTNMTSLDQESISLWYIEKDRKMASLRVGYEF